MTISIDIFILSMIGAFFAGMCLAYADATRSLKRMLRILGGP